MIKLILIPFFTLLLITGCSDIENTSTTPETNTTIPPDENTTNPPDENVTVSGSFIDAAVAGLKYTCSSGITGVTLSDGSYTCNAGDNVYFTLDTYSFPVIAASTSAVTPYTFFPDSLDGALNLARLLQSIDTDGDTNNSLITINTTLEALLAADINYTSPTFGADVEADLNITLVSANDAQVQMNASLLAIGATVPPIATNPPLANAGSDQNITVSNLVTLNASGSVANTYAWSFVLRPAGSSAVLLNLTTQNPTFVADVNGTYEIKLSVNTADLNFDTDRVRVMATSIVVVPPPVVVPPANSAPDINVSSSVDVFENQTSALTMSGSDDDNDTLVYSISGTDSANFSVDAVSGVVSFVNAPDYEIKTNYELIARVSDGSLSDEQNVSINILNIIELPMLEDSTFSIAENSATVSNLGQVTILTHGDGTITTFTLSGADADKFSINSSGVLSTASSFDYEIKTQYNLQVDATNLAGTSPIVNLVVNVTNIQDVAPTLVDTSLSFREDALVGDVIGSVTIDETGDSGISAISISGTGSTNFEFSTSGVLSVKSGASFDYETTNEYNLTAQATNLTGSSNTVNIYLQVNNVLDEVPIIADSSGNLDENASIGTSVGTLSITKVGDSSITSIDINGTGSSNFAVANNGDITLLTAGIMNFESTPSYTLTAIATNTAGLSNTATITITVGNIAEIPILENTSMSIMENELANAVVGIILIDTTSNDAGDSPITSIVLSGTGNANFVSDTSGQVTLSSTASIDFETTPSYTLTAVATNATGPSVSKTVTIAIDDYVFDPTQIARLNASDAEIDDSFASSLDISGDYMIVGAPNEDAGALSDGGSAYLFKKDKAGVVTELTKISATTPKSQEYFGFSVAMDANVIVVGAPEGASASGDAYIYLVDANDSVSLPPQQINLAGAAANGDSFGTTVDISGNYIIVGAPNNASAHLFKLDANQTATKVADITEVGLVSGDNYASSIAIDGNYIVIGAKGKSITSNSNGVVYIYEINPATDAVSLLGTQNLSAVVDYDYFGSSVGISGSYVVIGAYGIDTVATDAGMVYMYKLNAGSVTKVDEFAPNLAPDSLATGDLFGYSLAIGGEYIIVGAYKKDFGAVSDVGSAYVYHIDTTSDTASLLKKLDSPTSVTDDYFSASVAIDGDFMIVGAPNEDANASNAGAVFVYDGEPVP